MVGAEQGEDTETETSVNQGVSVIQSAPTNRIFIEQKGKISMNIYLSKYVFMCKYEHCIR